MRVAEFRITRFQFARDRVIGDSQVRGLDGQPPAGLIHRVSRPRGGNQRGFTLPFHEALQQALWDLAAKEANLPLWRYLGGSRDRVEAYASGLDFHLSDDAFV